MIAGAGDKSGGGGGKPNMPKGKRQRYVGRRNREIRCGYRRCDR